MSVDECVEKAHRIAANEWRLCIASERAASKDAVTNFSCASLHPTSKPNARFAAADAEPNVELSAIFW